MSAGETMASTSDNALPGPADKQVASRSDNALLGQTVLLTGATGFLGKAILEKLLFSLRPRKVFVLVRDKRAQSGQERWEETLQSPIWNLRLPPTRLQDVVVIQGDICDLGAISKHDQIMLRSEVDCVIHCAASVDFNMPLVQAIAINTKATISMYRFTLSLPRCRSFVYVSTAYVSRPSVHATETLRDVALKEGVDPARLSLPREFVNTYTFSKALAEQGLSREYHSRVPISIVRPSIIIPAMREPCRGWTDSAAAAVGGMLAIGSGLCMAFPQPPEHVIDIIPVDIVVNVILAACMSNLSQSSSPTSPVIYHATASENSVRTRLLSTVALAHFRNFPLPFQVLPPFGFYLNSSAVKALTVIQGTFYSTLETLTKSSGSGIHRFAAAQSRINKLKASFMFFLVEVFRFDRRNTEALERSLSDSTSAMLGPLTSLWDPREVCEVLHEGISEFLVPILEQQMARRAAL